MYYIICINNSMKYTWGIMLIRLRKSFNFIDEISTPSITTFPLYLVNRKIKEYKELLPAPVLPTIPI